MLYLITGVPGAGKTLNAIKFVLDKSNGEWFGRQIFYRGIDELRIPSWHKLTDEETEGWADLPKGSVIIIDEAQAIFPASGAFGRDVPAAITALNTHRHEGFDLILITQSPMLLQAGVRRLVGQHQHYDRRFGAKRVNRITWQRCVEDPHDYHTKKEGVSDAVVLDKRIFDLYKSAEIHTHKRKYPKKVIAAVGFFLLAPLAFWFGISSMNLPGGVGTSQLESSALGIPESVRDAAYVAGAERYLPRVPGLPHTAPVYDKLTEPKVYPRYQCITPTHSPDKCRCYSQQATVLDVPASICLEIIERGFFDAAIDESDPSVRPNADGPAAPLGGAEIDFIEEPNATLITFEARR